MIVYGISLMLDSSEGYLSSDEVGLFGIKIKNFLIIDYSFLLIFLIGLSWWVDWRVLYTIVISVIHMAFRLLYFWYCIVKLEKFFLDFFFLLFIDFALKDALILLHLSFDGSYFLKVLKIIPFHKLASVLLGENLTFEIAWLLAWQINRLWKLVLNFLFFLFLVFFSLILSFIVILINYLEFLVIFYPILHQFANFLKRESNPVHIKLFSWV